MKRILLLMTVLMTAFACRPVVVVSDNGTEYAEWFGVTDDAVIIISPSDGTRDTVSTRNPYSRIVCMSSTQIACLAEFGADSCICGVSGLRYVTNPLVRESGRVKEVGDIDYERVIALKSDLLCTGSDAAADYSRLESFGVKVLKVNDYLEKHPLARAEYIRLFGALTGRRAQADSVFHLIRDRYESLCELASAVRFRPSVLVNTPYKDAWYVPGEDSYFSKLIWDAGAQVAGAGPGVRSSVMTVEKAFSLSREADFWLHTGWAESLDALRAENPLFPLFPVLAEGRVFNNTRLAHSGGGNDYYESGSARPDLVLGDLLAIFHPELRDEKNNVSREGLHYYIELH